MNSFKEIYENIKEEKELYFELGRTLITRNKFRKAIEFLLEAKHLQGKTTGDWELSYLLGDGYKSLSNIKDAFECFIEAAINTTEFKSQCYEQAKRLITTSTAGDIHLWLENEVNNAEYIVLSDDDKKALKDLTLYTISCTNNGQNPDEASIPAKIEINNLIDEANTLIGSNQYKSALKKVEEALTREPANNEILFLKIRILVEGQIDTNAAAVLFNDEEFGYRKQFEKGEIINKLDQLLENNPDKGDSYFFTAFIGGLLDHDRSIINTWIEKAETLGLKNENVYPLLGLYLIKGEIAEKESKKTEAAGNFLEAAKCFYWQAGYTQACRYFEKAIQLNPTLNDAYNYYADTLFLLSYQPDPPYNNKEFIERAFHTWNESPGKIVQAQHDAWHYIVIARIHEIKYKFEKVNYYQEYWYSVLFAERAVVHKAGDYSLWMYLGMFYRNLDLETNSRAAFERAESLNDSDELLKEENIILLVNMGEYEKPLSYLKELKEKSISIPNIFKSYHKSWEGYIIFHKDKNPIEASKLFDEVINEMYSNLFAHQMKMICHWHALESAEAIREALVIIALRDKYLYLKEEFTFSWAFFISGQPEEAISMMENYNINGGNIRDNSFSLLQFYLYTGQIVDAENAFNTFITWTYNKRVLLELLRRLDALEYQFKNEKPALYVSSNVFQDCITGWKSQVNEKIKYVTNIPLTKEDEFIFKQAEYNYIEGSIPFIAVQAGLARIRWDEKNLPEAYRIYNSLVKYTSEFPETSNAIEQIETEVLNLSGKYIRDSKYYDAIEYLQQFDMHDPLKAPLKSILLSLAFFGYNNDEKSLETLQAAFNGLESNMEIQKLVWKEITDDAYNPKLTWNYGCFIKTNLEHLPETFTREFMRHMLENFWMVLMNKGNVLYPVVTPIVIEIHNDLASKEADKDDWYVIKDLIPSMRERIFQNYGVKPPGVRIRGNDTGLDPGTYIISLDEIPLVSGTVYTDKLFITKSGKDLQGISVTGDPGMNPSSGKSSLWVGLQNKELLNENNISYWEDYFDYIIAHAEALLVANLEMFIGTQFCYYYLEDYVNESKDVKTGDALENAAIIQEHTSTLLLFSEVLKGLVREKVSIKNKERIIQSFIKAELKYSDASDLIQFVRIDLKEELPVNTLKSQSFELPEGTEKVLKEDLKTEEGKTFLAMTPENCQEALSIIRDIIPNDKGDLDTMLITNDSQLRIHLKKLTVLEFPYLIVASREELSGN